MSVPLDTEDDVMFHTPPHSLTISNIDWSAEGWRQLSISRSHCDVPSFEIKRVANISTFDLQELKRLRLGDPIC